MAKTVILIAFLLAVQYCAAVSLPESADRRTRRDIECPNPKFLSLHTCLDCSAADIQREMELLAKSVEGLREGLGLVGSNSYTFFAPSYYDGFKKIVVRGDRTSIPGFAIKVFCFVNDKIMSGKCRKCAENEMEFNILQFIPNNYRIAFEYRYKTFNKIPVLELGIICLVFYLLVPYLSLAATIVTVLVRLQVTCQLHQA